MSQVITKKAPAGAKEVENFFGVYLLYCTNPKYKGRTYIGKTTDPNRRIFQHNTGKHAGGAWKTSNKGPWDMVLIVHGFPNDISALRFEWAWQHPQVSRRLNGLPPKKKYEKTYPYNLRLLASMLNLGPWNRLPLTVRLLLPQYQQDFPVDLQPPIHMPIVMGPVKSTKPSQKCVASSSGETEEEMCNICFITVARGERVSCLHPKCEAVSHLLCLAELFLQQEGGDHLLPVRGTCPTCEKELVWGHLISKRNGCYSGQLDDLSEEEDDD